MFQIRRFSLPKAGGQHDWKPYAFDLSIAALLVACFIGLVLSIHLHPKFSTLLLCSLFVLVWLMHKRRIGSAIVSAILVCLILDYFFAPPRYSLVLSDGELGLQLLLFVFFVFVLSLSYLRLKRGMERMIRQKEEATEHYEEQLRIQYEEASRHDRQINAFYRVFHDTRAEHDLQAQLTLIARTIEDIFANCGVRKCTFHLPGFGDRLFLRRYIGDANYISELSTSEEDSAEWVMTHAQPVVVNDIPLIYSEKGSYLRRVVTRSSAGESKLYRCSYLVPLLSSQQADSSSEQHGRARKVLGVLRLQIEDVAHPELSSIKRRLEAEGASASSQPEFFSELIDYATYLIERALLERVFAQREMLNRELQKQTEELQAAIISSVSHDFHMPLTLIKSTATSLLDQGSEMRNEQVYRQMLEDVVSEVNWLERIVGRMLALSGIEKKALRLEKELYPIETIIQNALDLGHMRSLLATRQVEKHIPDESPTVEVDPVFIEQVLANLIENAILHTPVESTVEIMVRATDTELVIQVADRGPGIQEDELERIFESFYRGKIPVECAPVPYKKGSGLGLAVCKGFVEAHGGTIWAENRVGGGAVFQFTLPR